MVSSRFESKMSWRPVAKPAVMPVAMRMRQAPQTRPKPDGKVLVYVYETPGQPPVERAVSVSSRGGFHPNSQMVFNGYPEEENGVNELEESDNDSRMRKLKNRAEEAGEGYKLLADVDPQQLKSASRGGRMFMKQKKRMENFTSPESAGKVRDEEDDDLEDPELGGERSTPWNISKTSPSAVRYNPTSIYRSNFSKKRRRDQILPPLRSPPPEWRAKVDPGYQISQNDVKKPFRRWNSVESKRKVPASRSESAPPLPLEDPEPVTWGNLNKPGSVIGMQSEPSKPQGFSFDARKYQIAPSQGVWVGKGAFTTTPHIQYDFNARPIGWSRAYAAQY